jgi:hypothetical protein
MNYGSFPLPVPPAIPIMSIMVLLYIGSAKIGIKSGWFFVFHKILTFKLRSYSGYAFQVFMQAVFQCPKRASSSRFFWIKKINFWAATLSLLSGLFDHQ